MASDRGREPESALANLSIYGFEPSAASSIPLYYQLYLLLQRAIRDGQIQPEERFPSEEAISGHFRVSRPTANRAVEELIRRGWLARRRGLGTFVQKAESTELRLLNGSLSFSDEIGALENHRTRLVFCGLVPATQEDVATLLVAAETQLVRFRRVHAVGARIVMVCDSWLPSGYFPGLETSKLVDGSLFRTLETIYSRPVRSAVRSVEAAEVLDAQIAELLEVPQFAPILLMTGVAFDQGGVAVERMTAHVKEGVAFRNVIGMAEAEPVGRHAVICDSR